MRILTEASGSLTSAYLLRAIRDCGAEAVGSDIAEVTAAHCLADDYIRLPGKNDPALWEHIAALLKQHRIDLVIPSFDEMMIGWAEHQQAFAAQGTRVIVSPLETVRTCQDKWATYEFFQANAIPTPATSLDQEHPLVKPRFGRGGAGVQVTDRPVAMDGMLSQQLAHGEEITVDAFFDRDSRPVYIIPRRRIGVRDGKSTQGETLQHPGIEAHVRRMADALPFIGPINFQCFVDGTDIQFIEINPRIAGGMALGFAASENWVQLIVDNLVDGHPITPKPVRHGLRMIRYYAECFVS